ncbi:MAG: amidohydrolase/deacetylase family metallohydrolase [Acidimicrobiales bacterium]
MRFDLLIKGGEVMDPDRGYRGLLDVAVSAGKIAAVLPGMAESTAGEVIDASGLVVTPGLVDVHTHIFRGCSYFGIAHDAIAWRSGVTTWVDAGSAGSFTLPGFRELILGTSTTRVRALLNVSNIGLVAADGELADLRLVDPELCIRTIERNRDLIVGLKVRMSRRAIGGSGVEPLRRALDVGRACVLPVMVHIGHAPPPIDEVLDLLRSGDLVTHMCTDGSMGLVDKSGVVRESARRARERGVLFDVGHGSSSFSFAIAEALAREEFFPDLISSDLHQGNVLGPVLDLPTCINKLLVAGMSLTDAIVATTSGPAGAFGLKAGSLEPGSSADIGIFALESGRFALYDSLRDVRWGDRRLTNVLTIVNGKTLLPRWLPEPAPWTELTGVQREFVSRSVEQVRAIARFEPSTEEDVLAGPSVRCR